MRVDAVIATYNRGICIADAVESLLQYQDDIDNIYIVVNGSTDNTMEVLEPYRDNPKIDITELSENLGAPAGKNIGMKKSEADLIIIIDDDAVFFTDNPVTVLKRKFEDEPDLGLVQFKIVNYQMKEIQKYEFPGDNPAAQGDDEFLISSFTGAGHAIRKSMLTSVGYYPDSFFYAHEELDLSFRAIIGGWKVKYFPEVGIYHMKDPHGRLPAHKMIEKMVINRMLIAYSYLPFHYRFVSGLLWLIKSAMWSRSLSVPVRALSGYFDEKESVTREPVDKRSMGYLKSNYGRLWY